MTRQANAVDFWRGLALVMIFVNHIPGVYYSKFTHAYYSISDSADLFVFLAGWALRHLVGTPGREPPPWYLVLRLGGRAITLYAAQIMITMIAIAMLASTAMWLNNPLLLEWHNAASVFQDPVRTHVGLALLTHQMGYFDILPLYVVLMLMAPFIALTDRYAPNWLLPLSVAFYGVVLVFQIVPTSWPVEGRWFFNPFAWQLLFVLGFVLSREDGGVGGFVRRNITPIRLVSLPVCLVLSWAWLYNYWPDPTSVPNPKLFFLVDKTFVTPPRIIQFLTLVAVMSFAYPYIQRYASRFVDFMSMLGRNSLYVFCVGSILSLAGQIIRYVYRGDFVIDTVVVFSGIAIMAFTAWLPEWRDRIKGRPGSRLAPAS